jgi:ferredoxin-like protein FixX
LGGGGGEEEEEDEEEETVSLYILINYSSFVPCSAACFGLQYHDQVCVNFTDCIACTMLRLITIKISIKIISLT